MCGKYEQIGLAQPVIAYNVPVASALRIIEGGTASD